MTTTPGSPGQSKALRAARDLQRLLRPAPRASAADQPNETPTASACFELHSGSDIVNIDLTVSLYPPTPFQVTGGRLTGDLPGSPVTPWEVIEGSFDGTSLYVLASPALPTNAPQVERPSSAVSDLLQVIAWYNPPLTYQGFYGNPEYETILPGAFCVVLFKGWQQCP